MLTIKHAENANKDYFLCQLNNLIIYFYKDDLPLKLLYNTDIYI